MYNPTLGNKAKHNKVKRKVYPNRDGVKNSDILRAGGVGTYSPDLKRNRTRSGFTSEVFSCKGFTQHYECLFHGNAKPFGYSKSGDKTVRVMSGNLFVTLALVDENGELGEKSITKYAAGSYLNLPSGTAYTLATSGTTDAEFLITQTAGYDKDFIILAQGVINKNLENVATGVPTESIPGRRPEGASNAMAAVEKVAKRRGRPPGKGNKKKGKGVQMNANSSTVPGLNLAPMGAGNIADND